MAQSSRIQRRSDGTVSIEGVRFEIPSRYRHLDKVTVRYASWDLGNVVMVDARTDTVLCRIYPVDKTANASGQRRSLEPIAGVASPPPATGMAPLLKKLVTQYTATGLPPAYIPKDHASEPDKAVESQAQEQAP
jgi:putative transposase